MDPVNRLVQLVVRGYFRVWHGLDVVGLENLPPAGPLLVVSNHASLLDPATLLAVNPYPRAAMFAKAPLFQVPLVGWLLRRLGALPVERRGRDLASLRAALVVLRAGGVLVVAAEGRRSRSGRLEPVNPVLARLALTAQVPVLAVGISGSFAALPPGARLPRRRTIGLRFGKPFRFEPGTSVEAARERLRAEIAALLPAEQQPLAAPV
jgi:1-acyl-sn-glycerol-3-phosphate acyltransferase